MQVDRKSSNVLWPEYFITVPASLPVFSIRSVMNVCRRLCVVNPFAWPYLSFANFPAWRQARAIALSNVAVLASGNKNKSSVSPSRMRRFTTSRIAIPQRYVALILCLAGIQTDEPPYSSETDRQTLEALYNSNGRYERTDSLCPSHVLPDSACRCSMLLGQ